MAEVLIIGSAAVSNVVYVDSLPSVSESVTGSIMYKFPGGNGVNQAISLTKLNKKAELITKVGKDDNGKIILIALKNEKVIINNSTDIYKIPISLLRNIKVYNFQGK